MLSYITNLLLPAKHKGKITRSWNVTTHHCSQGKEKTGKRRAWCLKGLRNTCERVWDWNVSVLIWKNRDLLFVLEETGEKEVGGGTQQWMRAKTNSKLLWGLKWVPINHPLLFWVLFHFQFHFRGLHPERLAQNYSTKQQTFNFPDSLTLIVRAAHSPRRDWRKNTSW